MKDKIHPAYETVRVQCACGANFETRSTAKKDIQVDVCSQCHPFYTGKQKFMDTAGRIDRLKKKFGAQMTSVSKKAKPAAPPAPKTAE